MSYKKKPIKILFKYKWGGCGAGLGVNINPHPCPICYAGQVKPVY